MTQAVIQTTVTGMQGRPIATTVPTANQTYSWSGTAWVPTGPYLPIAGGILTGALRLQYGTPSLIVNDTTTSITAGGLWRAINGGGTLAFQANTATAGDFSTANTALTLNSSGVVTFGNSVTVNGGFTVTGGTSLGGATNVNGTLTAGTLVSQGATFIQSTGSSYQLVIDGSNNRILSWASGYSFQWDASNAVLYYFSPQAGGGVAYSQSPNGNLAIAGTLSQGSDETSKTNINPITTGISLIRQLIPKSFAWNSTPNVTQWGFIAQDVQPVVPAAVGSMPAMAEGGTPTLNLDITGIVAAITMAVKQLDQRCTALESHDGITPPAAQLA